MSDRLSYGRVEDRTMPAVVYALYLLAIFTGVPVLLGLILAYICRGQAGPSARTHYTFLIRTSWLWIAWAAIGVLLIAVGAPLSLILVGLPVFALGWLILGLVHVWFAARAIIGVIHLARDEPYPRPYSWFL
jgi:uncharacterized membrane protein